MSLVSELFPCVAVDFLAEVGIDPGPDGVDPGIPLSDNTTSPEWQQISSDFPVGFAVYTEAVLDEYTGTIASLNGGELLVALQSFGPPDSELQILTVALPGDAPLRAAIPNPDTPGALQTIGISVRSKLLTVIVNCSVVTSVWLASLPSSVEFSTVEALNPSTTVSSWVLMCDYMRGLISVEYVANIVYSCR